MSPHVKILEMQAESRNWEFERVILEEYGFGNSMKMKKKDLMDWAESLKGCHHHIVTRVQEAIYASLDAG